jgi:hypothetical protein
MAISYLQAATSCGAFVEFFWEKRTSSITKGDMPSGRVGASPVSALPKGTVSYLPAKTPVRASYEAGDPITCRFDQRHARGSQKGKNLKR